MGSCDQWDGFAGHRRKVTSLLRAGGDRDRTRLCVLGVGNGNDLDLPALLSAHRAVCLVDLDAEALALGVARQGVAGHAGLQLLGGIDLTGCLDALSAWGPSTEIGPDDLKALANQPAGKVASILPGPFDWVASTCLLRPLMGLAYHTLGERHPRFASAVRAIRAGHLRLLRQLTAPGGTAILITDVVSSDTFPPLGTLPDAALPGLLDRLSSEGNYFHGVEPSELLSAVRDDPDLNRRITGLKAHSPWRWRLHDRVYLVRALQFQTETAGTPTFSSGKSLFEKTVYENRTPDLSRPD